LSAPEAVDGRDLSPVLADDTSVREVAVTEHPWSKTIRDARYKLTLFPPEVHGGQAHGELFDLVDDPWELNNLYDDPAQMAAREKLTLALVHWLATKRRPVTANPMPPPDPQQPGRRGGMRPRSCMPAMDVCAPG
jgi:arylsulfatase A-like enzyme